jgi:hypothetical protein
MPVPDTYDGTRECFGELVKAMLLTTECGDRVRQELREAASCVYRAEWAMVRSFNLDRLFLTWLSGPDGGYTHENPPPWLMAPRRVDHDLEPSIMVGTENLKPAEQRTALASRETRIANCADALAAGWPECDAVVFAGSREEWDAAKRKARGQQ